MINILLATSEHTIGIFEICTILSGLASGFMLIMFLYLIAIATKLRPPKNNSYTDSQKLSKQEIELIIKDKQKKFKNKKIRNNKGDFDYFTDLLQEMIEEIAVKYYPESENPILEITANDALSLADSVTIKLDKMFDSFLLKNFKDISIAFAMSIADIYKLEFTQKSLKIINKSLYVWRIINIINPIMWIKELQIKLQSFVIQKYYMLAFSLSAYETAEVYANSRTLPDEELGKILLKKIPSQIKIFSK